MLKNQKSRQVLKELLVVLYNFCDPKKSSFESFKNKIEDIENQYIKGYHYRDGIM